MTSSCVSQGRTHCGNHSAFTLLLWRSVAALIGHVSSRLCLQGSYSILFELCQALPLAFLAAGLRARGTCVQEPPQPHAHRGPAPLQLSALGPLGWAANRKRDREVQESSCHLSSRCTYFCDQGGSDSAMNPGGCFDILAGANLLGLKFVLALRLQLHDR